MAIIVLVVGFFVGEKAMKAKGKADLKNSIDTGAMKNTIEHNGKSYAYNDSIITVLCMGIDTPDTVEGTSMFNSGQSDVMFLLVLDEKNQRIRLVSICRDAMTDVVKYDFSGESLGTFKGQIALQYAFGTGQKDSGEMAMACTSQLFYGIPIHAFGAIHFPAVALVNDAVGGVTIQVPADDIDYINASGYQAGETIKLEGDKAREFVQSRNEYTGYSNSIRMSRQKQYIFGFMDSFKKSMKKDITTPIKVFKAAKPYINTNISVSSLYYLASVLNNYQFDDSSMMSVPGENTQLGLYVEYVVDQESLKNMVIDVFYEEIK